MIQDEKIYIIKLINKESLKPPKVFYKNNNII